MIVKMTKYTFLVYHKQYIEFLEKIREIGVLHVIEKPEGIPENDALREKMLLSARIKIALKQLEKRLSKEIIPLPADPVKDGLEVLINIENKLAQKESLEQKLQQI
ncbi:MAG TPA: V-type ATP synthase subunit I, partial [Paludibacteraceae bacterium]|nr:V-type ATP synthase subunit I [Paludibacteraceae bacterium]